MPESSHIVGRVTFQAVYTLLGEVHSRLHQHEEAERWYQAALQAEPGHVPAHLTYGTMLARNVSAGGGLAIRGICPILVSAGAPNLTSLYSL
jgi:hypothetical protein